MILVLNMNESVDTIVDKVYNFISPHAASKQIVLNCNPLLLSKNAVTQQYHQVLQSTVIQPIHKRRLVLSVYRILYDTVAVGMF